jgi:hypothetical protein
MLNCYDIPHCAANRKVDVPNNSAGLGGGSGARHCDARSVAPQNLQAFTRKLNEFGIAHEAEEYNGSWGGNLE